MIEVLFLVQIGGIFELFVEEIDLTRIAFSCHFALGDKEGAHDSCLNALLGTIALCEGPLYKGTCASRFFMSFG